MNSNLARVLAPADIKNFLLRASAAIKLDQVYVDALPRESFSPEYSDEMWRNWRRYHRAYIRLLLSTAGAIPPATLRDLTEIAVTHDPADVGIVVQELLAGALAGGTPEKDLATAGQFFGCLVYLLRKRGLTKSRNGDARVSILQWLPVIDPLRIAEDPECGYGRPAR